VVKRSNWLILKELFIKITAFSSLSPHRFVTSVSYIPTREIKKEEKNKVRHKPKKIKAGLKVSNGTRRLGFER